MVNRKLDPIFENKGVTQSRRRAIGLIFACSHRFAAAAADPDPPLRLAISESLVADVNMNDARAALLIWVKKITEGMNIRADFSASAFNSPPEILNRIRKGQVDAVALNVIEYRQVADLLDPSQIISQVGAGAQEQYLILVKRSSGFQKLGNLQGRRLYSWKAPKMCVAPTWLATVLDEARLGTPEQFFSSILSDTKVSKVVLPVFFGQAEACLTTRRGFDTMCELNPQVGKDLMAISTSPPMVLSLYIFRKNYQSPYRQILIKALSGLRGTPAGQQLSTLFQFEELTVRDASCLASALRVLEAGDRAMNRHGRGSAG